MVAYDSGRTTVRQPDLVVKLDGHCYNRGSMAKKYRRAYLLAPLIYLAVIVGLLFLQFSSGERFTRNVGTMSVSGTRVTPVEGGGAGVRSVRLSFNGLMLEFDDDSGLVIETPQQLVELTPRDIAYGDAAVLILFGEDVELVAQDLTAEYGELHLRVNLGNYGGSASRVSIPFDLSSDAAPVDQETGTFISIATNGETFFLTTPGRSSVDPLNRKIVLSAADAGQTVRYVQASTDGRSVINTYFRDGDLWIGEADLDAEIDTYVQAGYDGWREERYTPSMGTWRGRDGRAEFREEILTAYLAEAWRRDQYERAFAEMRRAADLHTDSLGLLSAPFVGSLDRAREQFLAADAAEAARIEGLLQAGDPRVFETPDLFRFAVDHVSLDLYERLVEFARTVPFASLQIPTVVALLRHHALAVHPVEEIGHVTGRFVPLLEDRVLPALVHADGGFFIQSSPGQVDVRTSLDAGLVLEELGRRDTNEQHIMIGRNLIRSVLARADQYGLLPATLHVRGGSVEREDGGIDPAEVYPLLVDNPNYPHEVSLYGEGRAEGFVFSAVPVSVVEITEEQWRFRLSYPRLRTHHVIVQGAPPIARMELFGQQWRDASDFEIYSKGRHYVASSQTLLVKYYDDSTQRDMVLYFR